MARYSIRILQKGQPVGRHELGSSGSFKIGRSGYGNDIEIPLQDVSRNHCVVQVEAGRVFVTDLGSTGGTSLDGVALPAHEAAEWRLGARLALSNGTFSLELETADVQVSDSQAGAELDLAAWLERKSSVTVGRSPECDVVLKNDMSISRTHARFSREGTQYFVEDLNSTNGTILNARRISGKTPFTAADTVYIGLYALSLKGQVKDLSQEVAIKAAGVSKSFQVSGKKKVVLQELTLNIERCEFVALMGPSGCGKSTLLKALNGDSKASTGQVLIHGLELNAHYDLLKRKIGYVPQDDIVHRELTVDQSLYFAAKLRMGDGVSEEAIQAKITEVLENLNINRPDIRAEFVGKLSGGQRKRVSIAVELLNNPSILFLDEPTSPLDPETISEFLKCIRRLTELGTTVVMVTHKPEDLHFVDRVIFLTTKGYLAYFGEKGAAMLKYFGVDNLIEIYTVLSDEKRITGWYEKWKQVQAPSKADVTPERIAVQQEGAFRQFWWLTRRYFQIKWNDRQNLALLLAQPVIIGGLIALLFDSLQVGVLFLMAIAAIWFGVSNAAKEIVGELPIYRRERQFNLRILTYYGSKVAVLSLIALVQVLLFVGIVKTAFHFAELEVAGVMTAYPLGDFGLFTLWMLGLSVSASLLGLLLSSWFDTTEQVMTVVPIALIPQIMFAGVVTRIETVATEVLSYLTLGRWGVEGFARLQDQAGPVINYGPEISLSETMPPEVIVSDIWVPSEKKAMDILDYYNPTLIDNGNLLGLFDGFWLNLGMVVALNLLVFAATVVVLRKK